MARRCVRRSRPMADAEHLVSVQIVPHGDDYAALARCAFAAPPEAVERVLLSLERFPGAIPLIQKGACEPIGLERWRCRLGGRLGIWRLGIPIEMRFEMVRHRDGTYELDRYLGGSFAELYFRHRILAEDRGGVLESLYYFDLQGFALLRHLNAIRHHPWLTQELQLMAAAMMVTGIAKLADAEWFERRSEES